MRLYQLISINESRGFIARSPGDQFIDPTNSEDIATFQGLTLIPDPYTNHKTAFESSDEFIKIYNDWKNNTDGTVFEINRPNKSICAAMIINMDTQRGLEHYVLFTRDNGNLTSKLTNIPANLIPNQGGYVLNKGSSLSERSGLKPSDIIKSTKIVSIDQVAELLNAGRESAGDIAVDQMQDYLNALADGNGDNFIIKNSADNIRLHQKYLGEWAAPIALITDQFEPKGQLEKIEEHMTGGESIRNGKISFNTNPSEALFDSAVLIGNQHQILISSKAKTGGAAASLQGLYDIITKEDNTLPTGFWSQPKAEKFKKIITEIMSKSSIAGILDVSIEEGLIDIADKNAILAGLQYDRNKTGNFKPTKTLSDYMDDYAANINHPQYSQTKHALSAIASKLCKKLNDENYTSIIKQLLNHANVVQMYFNASVSGKDIICKGFKLIWPAKFDGQIKFHSGKAFSATSIKGRIGFKIGSGSTVDNDQDESLTASLPDNVEKAIAKKVKTAKELAVGKITNAGEKDIRDTNVADNIALGRSKKK